MHALDTSFWHSIPWLNPVNEIMRNNKTIMAIDYTLSLFSEEQLIQYDLNLWSRHY